MNDHSKLVFFASMAEPCSYLDDRDAVSAFANPHIDMDMQTYNELIQHGFRRSGGYVYRPHCPNCDECVSVRIPLIDQVFTRNELRTIRRNSDLTVKVLSSKFHEEHFALYERYINSRHNDGSMANPSKSDYHRFLICDWSDTIFIEFRLNRQLIAVAVSDVLTTGLSAVYTFFDPKFTARSLGHFAILTQINEAKTRDMDYLYLGYWIKDCKKMSYKRRYQPLQEFINDQWRLVSD